MNRLVIIDGHALLHRAFHALPPLTNSNGEQINAVYGFASIVLRVKADLSPTHMTVCFDRPTPTFRNKLFKEYQSNRPSMDDGLSCQIGKVHDLVYGMGIVSFEMDGYEADDLIGTITEKIKKQNSKIKNNDVFFETIIVTGDRDLLQLVDETTKLYMPVKGISQSKLYGITEVEERMGVTPDKIVEFKAIAGDPSDNYPGIPGIGPKTAAKLVNRFRTVEEMYERIDEISNPKLREIILKNRESAEMSKKLAAVLTDAPIELDVGALKVGSFLNPGTVSLFERMEFWSLIPRLGNGEKKQTSKNMEQAKGKPADNGNGQTSLF